MAKAPAPQILEGTFPAQQSAIFLNAILENGPDAILIVKEDGKIIYANKRSEGLLGYSKSELIGMGVEDLMISHRTEHADARQLYHQSPVTRAMGHQPVILGLHKDGSKIPLQIALSPLPEMEDQGSLVVAVLRDALPVFTTQQNMVLQSVAMHSAANGIVITDTNGVIQWVNPAVTVITGYTSDELVGKNPRILKSGQHDPLFYQDIWKTVLSGRNWFGEIVNRRKNGTIYYEEQHIAPVRNEEGQITHLIAIKQDVTARREAEILVKKTNHQLQEKLAEIEELASLLNQANYKLEVKVQERTAELAKANEHLKELDNLKSAFIGVISHELRTPFTSLVAAIEMLNAGETNNLTMEQKDLIGLLGESIHSAHSMIENLVGYAAFVRRQGMLNLVESCLTSSIERAIKLTHPKAERKSITIETRIQKNLRPALCDEERIFEALRELLDNAVKFSPKGGHVTIACWTSEESLHVSVEDNGPGIPADKLDSLWESFSQMADPLRRGREGLGLGLALVEYVVRAHHGQVHATSQLGLGSNFGFRIPLEPSASVAENQA